MKKLLVLALFILPLAAGCGRQGGSLDFGTVVDAPVISPSGGSITTETEISVSCPTSGATIKYTTDGSEPTVSSTTYTAAFKLSSAGSKEVKARAYFPPRIPSSVVSASYEVTTASATPRFSVAAGTYFATQDVTITCSTSGASIYYSTDGTVPSVLYTAPVSISTTTTLRAKSSKTGYSDSPVTSEVITVKLPVIVDQTADVGKYSSLGIDGSGLPRIAYFDQTNQQVKHASYATGAWVITTVDTGLGAGGGYCGISVDDSGASHVSYYDDTAKTLKYATNASGSWVTDTADTGSVGKYTSIGVDSVGKAHISYFDETNSKVKYTTNSSGVWTVTASFDASLYPYSSIAVDPSDNVFFTFYDSTNSNYYYAAKSGASYTKASIGITNSAVIGSDTGFNCLSLDYSSPYVLAYAGSLRIASNSGSWSNTTVSSSSNLKYPSFKLDGSTKFHISAYDSVNKVLKYLTNASGSWVSKTIESTAVSPSGMYTSIAVDSNGKFHISYYDLKNKVLKYITNK